MLTEVHTVDNVQGNVLKIIANFLGRIVIVVLYYDDSKVKDTLISAGVSHSLRTRHLIVWQGLE